MNRGIKIRILKIGQGRAWFKFWEESLPDLKEVSLVVFNGYWVQSWVPEGMVFKTSFFPTASNQLELMALIEGADSSPGIAWFKPIDSCL